MPLVANMFTSGSPQRLPLVATTFNLPLAANMFASGSPQRLPLVATTFHLPLVANMFASGLPQGLPLVATTFGALHHLLLVANMFASGWPQGLPLREDRIHFEDRALELGHLVDISNRHFPQTSPMVRTPATVSQIKVILCQPG